MDKMIANENVGVHFVFFDDADQIVDEYTQAISCYLPIAASESGVETLPDDFIGPPNKTGKTA
jgi:hypothetical protein